MFKLVEKRPNKTIEHPLVGESFCLGRGKHSDITIKCSSISREHFKIQIFDHKKILVTDLESSNGTFINGERLEPHVDHICQVGDKISIGEEEIHFIIKKVKEKSPRKPIKQEESTNLYSQQMIARSQEVPQDSQEFLHTIQAIEEEDHEELIKIQKQKMELLQTKAKQDIELERHESRLQSEEEAYKIRLAADQQAKQIIEQASSVVEEQIASQKEHLLQLEQEIKDEAKSLAQAIEAREHAKGLLDQVTEEVQTQKSLKEELETLAQELSLQMTKVEQEIDQAKSEYKLIVEQNAAEKKKFELERESMLLESNCRVEQLSSDIDILISKKGSFEKECEALGHSRDMIAAELERARADRIDLEGKIEEEKKRLYHREQDLKELQEQKKSFLHQLEQLELDLENKRKEARQLIDEAHSRVDEMNSEHRLKERDFEEYCTKREQEIEDLKSDVLRDAENERDQILTLVNEKVEEAEQLDQQIKDKKSSYDEMMAELDQEIRDKRLYFDQKVKEIDEGLVKSESKAQKKKEQDKIKLARELEEMKTQELARIDQLRKKELRLVYEQKRALEVENRDLRKQATAMQTEAKEHAKKLWIKTDKELDERREKVLNDCNALMEKSKNTLKQARVEITAEQEKAREQLALEKTEQDHALHESKQAIESYVHERKLEADNMLAQVKVQRDELIKQCEEDIEKRLAGHEDDKKKAWQDILQDHERQKKEMMEELSKSKLKQLQVIKDEVKKEKRQAKEQRAARIDDIARNLEIIINQSYADHLAKKMHPKDFVAESSELKKLVKAAFNGKQELEGSKFQSVLMMNPEASHQLKRFWKRVAMTYGLPILGVLLLFNTYQIARDYLMKSSKEDSTSEVFVKKLREQRESKYNFEPKQTTTYKESYVDNTLYTVDYASLTLNESFQEKYVVALNSFLIKDLGLDETAVVSLNTIHVNLIKDIIKRKGNIISGFEEAEIEKMRQLEKHAVNEQKKILRTKTKYEFFKKFEQDFYFSYDE